MIWLALSHIFSAVLQLLHIGRGGGDDRLGIVVGFGRFEAMIQQWVEDFRRELAIVF